MKKYLLTAMSLTLATFMAQAADPSMTDKHTHSTNPTANPTAIEGATPDNTGVNKRDRDERTKTPLDQSLTKADQEITRAIRKLIMQQELSMNAKNVKVITQNGEVTLRGPVESRAEVEKIVSLAKTVPSVKTLHNQLEVN